MTHTQTDLQLAPSEHTEITTPDVHNTHVKNTDVKCADVTGISDERTGEHSHIDADSLDLSQHFPDSPYVESHTLKRILKLRGIVSPKQLDTSLQALIPASHLLGMDDAVALMNEAIDNQHSILIVGDFDADGATSTALMMRVLGDMGAVVNFLVPDRFKFGYGLTPAIVDEGVKHYQPTLIITVDNGISSHDGVAHAQALGIKVIITDHHLTTKEKPPAEAVVNPNQLGCAFESKALAGVGVAFYVLARLAKVRRQSQRSSTQVTRYLDLVALGTVADVAVLDTNNRILVTHGLRLMNQRQCCVGIIALLEQAGRLNQYIVSQDLGFILGPRINAAGRMDSMRIGIECLLSDDLAQAREIAKQLESLNQKRRHVESDIRDQALQMLSSSAIINELQTTQKKSIVLYEPSWHQGVVGIVAGRLKEQFYRPAIVFAPSDDSKTSLKGSARSISGIHIRDAIEQVANAHPTLITHFGGHAMAAGLTLLPEHVDAFAEAFEAVVATHDACVFTPKLHSDGALTAGEYSTEFATYLRQLMPWGHGFIPPVFSDTFGVSGYKVLKEKHLKLWLTHEHQEGALEAIWFNYQKEDWQDSATQIVVRFELDVNQFRGDTSLQLLVREVSVL